MASIQLKIYSAALKTRTNVNVFLPSLLPDQNGATKREHDFTTYYETHKDFPVLYLLHGTFGDEGDWQRFTRIEDYARNHNLAVVMPYGENSFYRDTDAGKDYETYITQELPQVIQWMFPVSKKREDTFIGGLSMGGTGAVRLGLAHPEIYGYTIGLSAVTDPIENWIDKEEFTVWSHAFVNSEHGQGSADDLYDLADKAMKSEKVRTKLYLAVGTGDFLYEGNCKYHEYLEKIGYEHVFSTGEGIHNFDFWDPQIRKAIHEWLPLQSAGRVAGL